MVSMPPPPSSPTSSGSRGASQELRAKRRDWPAQRSHSSPVTCGGAPGRGDGGPLHTSKPKIVQMLVSDAQRPQTLSCPPQKVLPWVPQAWSQCLLNTPHNAAPRGAPI